MKRDASIRCHAIGCNKQFTSMLTSNNNDRALMHHILCVICRKKIFMKFGLTMYGQIQGYWKGRTHPFYGNGL